MIASFENHACRPFHHLGRKKSGDVTRQTNLHAGFSKRFQNDVCKRRSAGGKTRDGVHVLFIKQNSSADGVEHAASNLEMVLSCMSTATNCRHAAADCRGCVRHRSNDWYFIKLAAACSELLLQIARRHGGRDGYEQSLRVNFESNLPQQLRHGLGLYGQQDDVGFPDGFTIIGAYRNTKLTCERGCPL